VKSKRRILLSFAILTLLGCASGSFPPAQKKSTEGLTMIRYCISPWRTFAVEGTDIKGVTIEELTVMLRQHKINHPESEYELLSDIKCQPETEQEIIQAIAQAGIQLRHYWAPVSTFGTDEKPSPYGSGYADIIE